MAKRYTSRRIGPVWGLHKLIPGGKGGILDIRESIKHLIHSVSALHILVDERGYENLHPCMNKIESMVINLWKMFFPSNADYDDRLEGRVNTYLEGMVAWDDHRQRNTEDYHIARWVSDALDSAGIKLEGYEDNIPEFKEMLDDIIECHDKVNEVFG